MANSILGISLSVFRTILTPVWAISALLIGIASHLPLFFAIYTSLLNIIWMPFAGFIMSTSWLYQKSPVLRLPLVLVSIPVLVSADIILTIMADMDRYGKYDKAMVIDRWPFSSPCDIQQMPFNRVSYT
ncbi:MAG: hypothetical protein HOC20_10065 [Chloroflexi bacterium]|jgi:hypothetical protein|nr:hypothetical protein [Chloroflexota bacterium]